MDELEATFVNAFIARDKRERWLSLLSSEKGRGKLLDRLAHVFQEDLDPRFVYDRENLPTDVAVRASVEIARWAERNPQKLCYIIANNSAVDQQTISLETAESDYRLTFGAIVVLIPNKLAYYFTERSNLNRQPFYLLLRP